MIRQDTFAGISAAAAVPEQVAAYVTAVSDSNPRMFRSCVGYQSGSNLVLIGYPLQDSRNEQAMAEAVDEALRIPELKSITVTGPARPPQAPADSILSRDAYSLITVPPNPPGQKLRNMLRRAGRELTVQRNKHWENEHRALVQKYLESRILDSGTIHIFQNIPDYLAASPGSLIFSARTLNGSLAAFAIGEFSPLKTAFFMFCFRDPFEAPPGSTDLLLSALLQEADRRGHTRVNLGLGINKGIRFFKSKWDQGMQLPYVQASWSIKPEGFSSRLRRFFFKRRSREEI